MSLRAKDANMMLGAQTATQPIRNPIIKLLRILVDLVMFLLLLGGAANIWMMTQPNELIPNGPDDVGSVQITVKSLKPVSPMGCEIFAEEIPTKFVLGAMPSAFNEIKSAVKAGDKISLRVKKELIGKLQDLSMVLAYGVSLENGTNVFDTSQHIPKHTGSGFSAIDLAFYAMVGIPLLYFLRRLSNRKRAVSQSI
jgi:hypothetical protein